ncbi:hypothetical protein KEM55_004112 [Ascosphaera atra]|nr:hypothetical protein KEM55_004112 [Ascosphaera atra]
MPVSSASPRQTRTSSSAAPSDPTDGGQPSQPSTPTKPRLRADRPPRRVEYVERQEGKEGSHRRRWMCGLVKGLDIVETEFVAGEPRRDLVWKEAATRREMSGLDDQKKLAVMMQLGGRENPVPCGPCSRGNPFVGCVSSSVIGNGACAGCKWGSNAGRCNYRKLKGRRRRRCARRRPTSRGSGPGWLPVGSHRWVTLPAGYREWPEATWREYRTELEKAASVVGMRLAGFEEERGWYD